MSLRMMICVCRSLTMKSNECSDLVDHNADDSDYMTAAAPHISSDSFQFRFLGFGN